MTEFFKNNPIALRQCLLYEFLRGNCAEKAFVDVSRAVGKNMMNKKEIQVWFRRFAKGKFYKNCKKHDQVTAKDKFQSDKKALRTCILYLSLKSAKKTNENRYLMHSMDPREIHDLFRFNPSFVMYEEFRKVIGDDVMEYLEFDFWFHRFAQGSLHIYDDRSRISFGCLVGDSIQYTGTTRKFKKRDEMFKGTHWEQAVQDFNEIVHSFPKLHLGILQITSQRRLNGARFKGPTQLHVNCLILEASTQSIDIFPRILRVLKPGYLETITVYSDSLKKSVMRKVVEMDQWKQAKYLIMNEAPFPGTIRDLFHFKQSHVHCEEFSVEDMREMREILFNSLGFEKCTVSLDTSIDFAAVREEFGDAIHRHTHKYQMPNSTDHFELKIFEFEIRVARKM